MADLASSKLKSIADEILGEDPTKKAASGTARAIGLGERAAGRTQASMESSIRGIERVGRQMQADSSSDSRERERKVTDDMATWIAAIKSSGVPESVGSPLDVETAMQGAEDYVKQVGSKPSATPSRTTVEDDTQEPVVSSYEGMPSFMNEGTTFRKALKAQEADNYDTLFGNAERGNTPFKGVKVTDMTLGEVLDFSSSDSEWMKYNKSTHNKNTTALGKYQFVGATLRDLDERGILKKLGITKDTKFNAETQDKIAVYLAERRVVGKSDQEARRGLRNEWEGFKKLNSTELNKIIAEIREG